MNVGMKLKIARIKINKKQYEIAKAVGISSQYLRQLENGKADNPSKEVMMKLSEVLNTPVGELFFDEN